MNIFRRNAGKLALVALMVFFTLPFIYDNEKEEDFSPFAVKSGMSYQSNPISKLANKIASFYGFSGIGSNNLMASANGVDSIKDKVANNNFFNKENVTTANPAKANGDVLVASSRNFKNHNLDKSGVDSSNYQVNSGSSNFGTAYTSSNVKSSNSPVKGYVSINGKNYEVIEDIKGERYVVTPRGHIPYNEIVKRTISEQEFASAKKRLAGASDAEVLATLQQEKSQQAYKARNNGYNTASASGYRNGRLSNMGNASYAKVSTSDKGFDDNILSDAYSNLKNMDVKVDASSNGGVASGSYRDSYGGRSANNNQIAPSEGDITPASIASQARQSAQQSVQETVANNNVKKNNKQTQPEQPSEEPEQPISQDVTPAEILRLQRTKGEEVSYQPVDNEGQRFMEVNDLYSCWKTTQVKVNDTEKTGVFTEKTGVFLPDIRENHIVEEEMGNDGNKENIEEINKSIDGILAILPQLRSLDVKIYVDKEQCDDYSYELLKEVLTISTPDEKKSFLVNEEEKDKQGGISLPGFILTPDSFKEGLNNLRQQVEELTQQAENKTA